jgi:hypothetical protein
MKMFGFERKPAEQKQLTLPEQRQVFENKSGSPIEVWVEMMCRHFILQPGDKMEIWAAPPPTNEGFTTIFHEDGVQIYAGWDGDPRVSINGKALGRLLDPDPTD